MDTFKISKKKKIVFFAANTFLQNDAFFPVLLYLASRGVETRIIFEIQSSLKAVKSSTSLWSWLNKYAGDIVCFEGAYRYIAINNLIRKARKIYYILSVIFCKEAIVFLPLNKTRTNSVLDRFSNVWYYHSYGGFDFTERWNMNTGLTSKQRKFAEKPRPPKPIKAKFFKKIVFLTLDKEVFNKKYIWDKHLIIPYPHMQSWWHGFMKDDPPRYGKREQIERSKFITILLLRKGNYIFEDGSDVDVLLDEIVAAIRKHYHDSLIVLKPKYGQDGKCWLDDDNLYDRYKDKNIVITYDTLTSLSCKTAFAVSTGHTTGNYYMLSRGIPVIEYCRYSEGWRDIFPKETSIEEYGGVSVKDIKSLEACIKNIMNHKIDLAKLKEKIGYKDIKPDIDLF